MFDFNNLNLTNITITTYAENFEPTYTLTFEHPTNPNILHIHVEVTKEYITEHNITLP